jgi:GrpB-like predicted nucleotidyltransferase (UPF0157 family)
MKDDKSFATRTKQGILAVGVFGTLRIDQPFNEDLLKFYSCVYGRETEIPHMPNPTRHLTYESYMDNGYKIVFTGCEVDNLSDIPPGMYGFEASFEMLRIYSGSPMKQPMIEADIKWKWRHSFSAFNNTFIAGDFIVDDLKSTERIDNISEGPLLFCFSENAYDDYGNREYKEDEILLEDPNPAWHQKYMELERWIQLELPENLIPRIEHFGSTAIPGMPAKPIIDILVEVPSLSIVRSEIVPRLCSEDCSYGVFMNYATFCKRESYRGKRIAHIHMAPKDNPVWKGIKFRDYLRQNSNFASDYAQLKRELASKFRDDRNHYTMGKADFVNKISELMKNADKAMYRNEEDRA